MAENEPTAGEQRVLSEAPSGKLVDLGDLSDEQRVVSPDVIRRLCVGPEATGVDPRGIWIEGAYMEEPLDLSYCTIPHPLRLDATTFDAPPDLSGAQLPALWIEGCSFPGLRANGIRTHDLRLGSSEVSGEVALANAKIGQLDCSGATFSNEDGMALFFDSAEIGADVRLYGFSALGGVRFVNARIGGQLGCSGATLMSTDVALLASGAEISGSVFLTDRFSATGAVWFPGARIGGQLNCSGATLRNEDGMALFFESAEIGADVLLGDGFSATGEVRLLDAKIGGQLNCMDATLSNVGGDALAARHATIASDLFFRHVRVTGGVSLFRASARTLVDDVSADRPLGSWEGIDPLVLDGFSYSRFGGETEWGSKLRTQWLKETAGFQQGAWQQLIEVYRAQGQDDDAKNAAIAMHNDRVKRAGLPPYRRWGRQVLRVVIGHGYRPWLAGVWAAGIIAAFALVVWQGSGMFVPEAQGLTGSPQPVAYAADTFLPIVDLGEAKDWKPTGWVRWVDWSVILFGWALTTIFVAGFTRIVRS